MYANNLPGLQGLLIKRHRSEISSSNICVRQYQCTTCNILYLRCLTITVLVVVVLFLLIDTLHRRPQSMFSACGIVVFTLFMFIFSKDPRQVTTYSPIFVCLFRRYLTRELSWHGQSSIRKDLKMVFLLFAIWYLRI